MSVTYVRGIKQLVTGFYEKKGTEPGNTIALYLLDEYIELLVGGGGGVGEGCRGGVPGRGSNLNVH